MRYREKNGLQAAQVLYSDTNTSFALSPNVVNITQSIPGHTGELIQTWDVVTPNYFRRRKAGELIVNDFKSVKTTRFDSSTGVHVKANNPHLGGPPDYFLEQERTGPQLAQQMQATQYALNVRNVVPFADYHQALNQVSTRAYAGVLAGDADVLVMLAELKKTFSSLLNPLQNLRKLFTSIQRAKGAIKGSLSLGQYISSEWLKYRYGILPIMYDIEGIIKALGRDTKRGRHTSRATQTLQASELGMPCIWAHGDLDTTYQDTYTDEVILKCGLIYNAELQTTDYLGLNLRSIPTSAWELIPFSFVVDWFLNAQHYIRAMSAHGLNAKGGAYTVVTRTYTAQRAIIGSVIARSPANSTLLRPMSGSQTIVRRVKIRYPGVAAPSLVSKINLSLFEWKDRRVKDALALVFTMLNRR